MVNNIEQQRLQATEQYDNLVSHLIHNTLKVSPEEADMVCIVLDCRSQQEQMLIFYRQDVWLNSEQLANATVIKAQLLSQGEQIIRHIKAIFEPTDIAPYTFIQLRYHYQHHEWQSHFVWADELTQPDISLTQFVSQWQYRMQKTINVW